ncbi:MAG: CAP domain-containing protein [Microcystaceae cyanobacterium]
MLLRFFPTVGAILLLFGSLTGCQQIEQGEVTLTPTSTPEITPQLADPATLRALERELYTVVNKYRRSRQLPPLNITPTVSQHARLYSKQMAAKTIEFGENKLSEKVKALSISLNIENAAQTIAISPSYPNPIASTLQGWINNPSQRQYLEGDYDLTGIGIAQNLSGEYYITQIFIKESPDLLTQPPQWETSLEPWKNNDPFFNKQPTNLSKNRINNNNNNNASLIELEQEINRQVNQYRLSQQLPPLKMNARISQIARVYSQKMASKQATFSHDGFDQRVKAMQRSIPLRSAAENLAYLKGYPDLATTAVQGWINSPGHQKNMVGDFNVTGIGIAKNAAGEYYFTQLFLLQK